MKLESTLKFSGIDPEPALVLNAPVYLEFRFTSNFLCCSPNVAFNWFFAMYGISSPLVTTP